MPIHSSNEDAQPKQAKPDEPVTPESLREIQRNLENASLAFEAAAAALAAAIIPFPEAAHILAPLAAASVMSAIYLDWLATDSGRRADRLKQKSQGGLKSPAPPEATPNMAPGSTDSLLGPDPMIGASLAPVQGATKASWLPDDVIARLEKTSEAGRGLADALARIEQAGQAVGEVLAIDDARLAEVADSLDRASRNVGGFGDSMTELKDIGERTFGRIKEVLVDFTETGKFEWQDLARVALDAVSDMLASVAASGGGSGGFASVMESILAALGGLFGGPREHGGPVAPGQAFLVGEAGPELFVPPAIG